MQARQQGRHFRPCDMGRDPQSEMPRWRLQAGQRALVGGDEVARAVEERRPLRRQPHRARRPFDQTVAQPILQPPQLHADGALRRAQSLSRAREALIVGHHHEGPDRLHIERGRAPHPNSPHPDSLSLKSIWMPFRCRQAFPM
jgi:hypothetical protein